MRRVLALMMVLTAVLVPGCGGEPNTLFEATGYHVRDGHVFYLNAFPGRGFQVDGADADSFEVLDGGYAPATAANPRPHGMPPFGQVLNDNDISMLVTYIRNSWGNEAGAVSGLEVKRARASSTLN